MAKAAEKIRIRPFESRFAAPVLDLILHIQTREFGLSITAEDQPDLSAIPDFYQTGKGNFWLALEGDRVVGTIALIDIGHGMGALRKMFVRPAFRGGRRRIAQRLLQVLLDWAHGNDMHQIYLGTTHLYLAAHRFYEKHGFVEVDKSSLPPEFPVMAVDTRFYRYDLTGSETDGQISDPT